MSAVGVDRLGTRVGLNKYMGTQTLSGLIGLLAGIVVFIPIATAALTALGLESLTQPLTILLTGLLAIGARIALALLLVFIAFVIGRIVADLVTSILEGLGFDNVLAKMGVSQTTSVGGATPSRFVGTVLLIAIIWLSAISAFTVVGLPDISASLQVVLSLAYQIALGLIIFAIGLWLAKVFGELISSRPALTGRGSSP